MVNRPQQMSADPKEIVHHAVDGEEPLRVRRRLEAAHLALALPCRLMGDFRSIVRVPISAVDHGRHDRTPCGRVAPELVRDQTSRRTALPFQQLPEEARGGTPIAPGLHEDVDHVAVVINRAP